ncbi:MAG: hypothetical protein C4529_04340 [Deltaproteobacteria bacterium]|nr:MAG: hypothetical protein C4529_04340 [Deltaproteobacteria bacterium]
MMTCGSWLETYGNFTIDLELLANIDIFSLANTENYRPIINFDDFAIDVGLMVISFKTQATHETSSEYR